MERNYGVDHPMRSEEIRFKHRQTMKERYGYEYFSQCPILKEKIRSTFFRRYGVTSSFQIGSPILEKLDWSKIRRTQIENESRRMISRWHSKPENDCFEVLCSRFGIDDVKRSSWVARHSIDFYVKSIDTYIEFDGIYWHGLNRPIEKIAEHRTAQDVRIHRKFLRDRELDLWFTEHDWKLVRITDMEFDQMKKQEDFYLLWERLGVL
jgi:hypothetical protein